MELIEQKLIDRLVQIRVFYKLDKIGSNATIGIRGFTTWKQKFQRQNITPSEYWTWASN